MECNNPIIAAKKEDVLDRIPGKTARYYDKFNECRGCNRIYWQGSHYAKMQSVVNEFICGEDNAANVPLKRESVSISTIRLL